jgi:hypothetical protein
VDTKSLAASRKIIPVKSVRFLRQIAQEWREMFEVSRVERQLQAVADGCDQAVIASDIMTEFETHQMGKCPIKISLNMLYLFKPL